MEFLLRDHREIAQALGELEAFLDARKSATRWTPEDTTAFERVRREFEQAVFPHARMEDEVFYSFLEDFLPRDIGPLAVLRGEHRDFENGFQRMNSAGTALSQGAAEPYLRHEFLRHGSAVLQTLRDHMYKEEHILFPMVVRFLSPEREALLLRQMEARSPHPAGHAKD